MTYPEWVQMLLRAHRAARGHRERCTGCWACDVLDLPETDRMRCADLSRGAPGTVGGFDGHHVIPKQLLKRERDGRAVLAATVDAPLSAARMADFDAAMFDVRIGVPLRRWHHDQWEARMLRVPRAMLPAGVEEIAVELGLEWWLDRTFS